jgi:hypothetical protein
LPASLFCVSRSSLSDRLVQSIVDLLDVKQDEDAGDNDHVQEQPDNRDRILGIALAQDVRFAILMPEGWWVY